MADKPKTKPKQTPRPPKSKIRPELSIHYGNDTRH